MDFGEVFEVLIVFAIPAILIIYLARRLFATRKQLEAETRLAAEKAAQYGVSNAQLEARVRVLEQIVTDGGAQTAAQIEALREQPRLASGDKVQ